MIYGNDDRKFNQAGFYRMISLTYFAILNYIRHYVISTKWQSSYGCGDHSPHGYFAYVVSPVDRGLPEKTITTYESSMFERECDGQKGVPKYR